MVVRTKLFFLGVFFFSVFLSIFLKTSSVDEGISKDAPSVEMYNFTSYNTTKLGTPEILTGEKSMQYKDKIVTHKAVLKRQDKNTSQTLSGNEITLKNNLITIIGKANYTSKDKTLKADKLSYDTKTMLLKSYGKFTATQKNTKLSGTDLIYNHKKNTIKAKNINGSFVSLGS